MKSFFVTFCLVVLCIATHAQDNPTLSIPEMLERLHSVPSDTARFDLLLNIAFAYVLKPGEEKTDLDSAFLLIGQAKTANDQRSRDPRITGLCELISAKAWREQGKDSLARIAAFRALDTFRHQNDPLDLAYAYCLAANFYDINRSQQDSIRVSYLRQAIPIFDSLGKTEEQARFRELLGEALLNFNGVAEALPVLLESKKIYLSMGHTDLSNLYSVLGTCYSEIGDARQAIDYEFSALRMETAAHPGPQPGMITAYARLAGTYSTTGQFENAVDMYKKGYELAIRLKRDGDAGFMGTCLALLLNHTGRSQEALDTLKHVDARYNLGKSDPQQEIESFLQIYLKLKQREQLIKYGEALTALCDRLPPRSRQRVHSLLPLTDYALTIHQFDRARKYDLELIDASRYFSSLPQLVVGYRLLYQIDSAKGDQAAALSDFRKYIDVRDSSSDITHVREVAGLKVEYDTEKKDDSIRALTQSQVLSQAALHQTGIARNATVAAAILLLVLLMVAINRYRLKQRSNHQLQLQKTEIDTQNAQLQGLVNEKDQLLEIKDWLMKELNHRMGNNLHFMMSLQNMQAHNLTSEEALNAIMQSNNRLYAMSLIHKKLYQPDSEGTINMAQYIGELVLHLSEALSPGKHIALATRVANIELDISQAVPVGLILNEAITNAYKYAFKDMQIGSNGAARPHINISLETIGETELEVMVKDNGIGYSVALEQGKRSSLGFLLMEMLTTQLRGTLTILNEEGLSIRLRFPGEFQPMPEKVVAWAPVA